MVISHPVAPRGLVRSLKSFLRRRLGRAAETPAAAAPARAPVAAEPLEPRQLMSVSYNASELTVVTPSADSRVVYVSTSTGSDSNTGLSASSPVRTLAKGSTLVRAGMPDQMLLKRGDVWNETFGYWKKGGRSVDEPMVIGAYGAGERPEVRSGTANALTIGSISAQQINNLAVLGLRFRASGRDPSLGGTSYASQAKGVSVIAGTQNLLIEDCKIEKYQMNVLIVSTYAESHDLTFRRNIVIDSFTTSGGSSGLFADGARGLTITGNTFDHNGWNESIAAAKATNKNHNIYITGNTSDVTVENNTIANASGHGLQARSGGNIRDNMFLNNPTAMSYGVVNGEGVNKAGGVTGVVSGNYFTGGRDISGAGRGVAIEIANVKSATIRDNLMSTSYAGSVMWAISLIAGDADKSNAVGLRNLTIEDNTIYRWYKGLFLQYELSPYASSAYQKIDNVNVRRNKFVDITSTVFINTKSGYINIDNTNEVSASTLRAAGAMDVTRNVPKYMASIGQSASNSAFLSAARNRSAGTVDFRYTAGTVIDYVRAGFGMD